ARRGLRAAVFHPSFTEPELELRRAGVPVERVVLDAPFRLDPAAVPEEADLVVVGNPTNPTSVLHPRADVAALCRPGRVTVVDEAFCDVVADEASHTLAGAALPGLVVLRSLTKTWALAGLRVGYAVGDPAVLADLADRRPHWPLGTLQLEAIRACLGPEAEAGLDAIRAEVAAQRTAMLRALGAAGIAVVVPPEAPFVLVRTPRGVDPVAFREGLAGRGIATRRCDTFPGLDAGHLRLAVREGTMVDELVAAWRAVTEGMRR
ncbi:MAG TPA: aminotransferase class I/II-fold pyridoxal phosphate-dependent enzyme, partial [Actinomycetales bacterium]|nr:aminotransferase class I/II-fold pyridoxal phosphate-dependent enzyme [Actinomycetales bacterium]